MAVSYLACHILLSMVMAIRGLSLKDMGLMGLITCRIWAACGKAYGEGMLPTG